MVNFAEPLLSAFLQVLFGQILSHDLIDYFSRNVPDGELLERLKMSLVSVTAVFADAEEKQFFDPFVREWVDKLKDALYDAEHLLDEVATRALYSKTDQVRDYVSSLNPFNDGIKSKVKMIIQRLDSMVKHKEVLGLKEGIGEKPWTSRSLPTTCLVDESEVYGRDGEKERIMEFLLSENENRVALVAIVGMAGIGKTTLAQVLYNDPRVKTMFRHRSWVSVSAEANILDITKRAYESLTKRYYKITDFNLLQEKLKKLVEQRILIVLDDYWNENFLDWEILLRPFKAAGCSIRIIITTRIQHAAVAARADLIHLLAPLSDEDCWKLFSCHAFKSGNPNSDPALKEIGQEIVKRCGGLPLAAKTLGSLLRSKVHAVEWNRVLTSKIWDLPEHKSNILLPALILSYQHLPSHLKRCFAYCCIFPKGHSIEKRDLIYQWMAEGLLPQPEAEKRMEDVGEEYINELLSRSFFQQSTDNESHLGMHGLVNDLALCVWPFFLQARGCTCA